MGENHTIGNIMGITMDKLKEMVDVNTIIGDPIQLQDGTAIIPIQRFLLDLLREVLIFQVKCKNDLFGGGSGAGVSIQPLAFMVVYKGEAKLMQMSVNASTPNALVNLIPDVVDKISDLIGKD